MISRIRLDGRAADPALAREEVREVQAGLSDLFEVPCPLGDFVVQRDKSSLKEEYTWRASLHPQEG